MVKTPAKDEALKEKEYFILTGSIIEKRREEQLPMKDEWESPSLAYKIMDEVGNNHLFGPVYTNYIKTVL